MSLEANQKLQAEMAEGKKYVNLIGQYLLDHLKKNPADAELVMTEEKTIKGSISAIRTEAMKTENGGMLSDPEGYAIVLDYFGINGQAPKQTAINTDDLF